MELLKLTSRAITGYLCEQKTWKENKYDIKIVNSRHQQTNFIWNTNNEKIFVLSSIEFKSLKFNHWNHSINCYWNYYIFPPPYSYRNCFSSGPPAFMTFRHCEVRGCEAWDGVGARVGARAAGETFFTWWSETASWNIRVPPPTRIITVGTISVRVGQSHVSSLQSCFHNIFVFSF